MSPIIAESTAPKKIITIISGKVFKNGPNKICGKQSLKNLKRYGLLKACVRYFFYQFFTFSSNDSPLKTMKNVFYYI